MRTLEHQRWVRIVGILCIVRGIQNEFRGTVAMEKVIFRANDETTLCAEHTATGTTIVRKQTFLVAFAQQHIADAYARSQQIE